MRSRTYCGRPTAPPKTLEPDHALRSSTLVRSTGGGFDEVGVGLVDAAHPGSLASSTDRPAAT